MIRVEVRKKASSITKILVEGHAGSGPYGHDLCCAAVSAILFGGFNALKDDESLYRYDIKEGHALLEVKQAVDAHEQTILETIAVQLRSVQSSYPENIEIHLQEE